MKILLFGEFSGFFNCLKSGLQALGHDVFLASNGDSFKDYPSDFRWDKHPLKGSGKLSVVGNVANIWLHKGLLKGYDVVHLIAPNNISMINFLNKPIYEYLFRNNRTVYLSGAGGICTSFDFWYNSDTKYHEYFKGYFSDNHQPREYNNTTVKKWEDELFSKIDGYIPIWYEYAEPFRDRPKLTKTIRIPIEIDKFEYKPNVLKDGKVVFYHGITRACKGTRFIKSAFEKMQEKYGDVAEFIIREKMPFDEYMKVVERTNIIVDDANSYSIAMNGLFSMAKGKLIMGGAEPEGNRELGFSDDENPVFNICPDVDQICSVIEHIINNRDRITEWGLKGRKFVEKYHNHIDIARQYIEIWEQGLCNKK